MMKAYILISCLTILSVSAFSQRRFFTKSGHVSFVAGTALEDIDAVNNSVASVLDASSGQIEYAVLVKSFEFKRALMQEHFNENYMESDKYPKSVFKGEIIDIDKLDFQKDGYYPVTVKGILEVHGVKREIQAVGNLKIGGEAVEATSEFTVLLSDYNITIPGLVRDKISKSVTIKINCRYNLLK